MFERFTGPARDVVVLAQEEARALGHNYVGTEHLLLGLLREKEGIAARVLTSLNVRLDDVRGQVARIVGQGIELDAPGQIPFTPRAKKVLELALREAREMNHGYIGTEHVLLGLARENDGVAIQILRDFGVDSEKIGDEVIRLLGGASVFGTRAPRSTPLPRGGRAQPLPLWRPATLLVAGWLLFAIALGIGVLVGWAIWG